jgi:acyl-CoA synthetase (AMP-forming)/AMP-acid ligase II
MVNLAILLEDSVREVPERTAIIFDETRLSYAAVNAAANQKEGAEVTEAEVIAWAKQTIVDYKYPRLIEFRTELPTTATGKVLKSELRQEKKGE